MPLETAEEFPTATTGAAAPEEAGGDPSLPSLQSEGPAIPPDPGKMFQFAVFNRIRLARPTAGLVNTLNTCAALARLGATVTLHGDMTGVRPEQVLEALGLEPMTNLRLHHTTWGYHDRTAPLAAPGLLRADPARRNVALFSEVRRYAPPLMRAARRRGFTTAFEAHNAAGMMAREEAAASPAALRHALEREIIETAVLELADILFVPQPRTLEAIRPLAPPGTPLVLLPNGTRVVSPAPPATKEIEILYAGSLMAWKGVETIIGAAAALAPHRLTVLGGHPGPERAALERMAADLGCRDRVTFVEAVPPAQVWSYYARAKVGVVPLSSRFIEAREYTCPVKLMEMMGAGLAIVAARQPSVEEFVRDGREVLLAGSDSPEEWASAIRRLLQDSALASRLAEAAHARAAEYSYERRALRILQAIEGMAKGDEALPIAIGARPGRGSIRRTGLPPGA